MNLINKVNKSEYSFLDYLDNPFQDQQFSISSRDNLYFKWFDAKFSTDYVKQNLLKNTELLRKFSYLNTLKETKIWIKQLHKVQSWLLYDFYKEIINNGLNQFKRDVEVSFISPMGPFKKESLTNFIKPNLFHDIVVRLLLDHELRQRNFRFRVDGMVKIFCDGDVYFLNVNQISQNGILLSLNNESSFLKIQKANNIKFLFDSSLLQKTLNSSIDVIKNEFSNYPFKLFLTNDEVYSHNINISDIHFKGHYETISENINYLYINFHHIKSCTIMLEKIVYEFSENLKNQLENELKKNQPLFLVK